MARGEQGDHQTNGISHYSKRRRTNVIAVVTLHSSDLNQKVISVSEKTSSCILFSACYLLLLLTCWQICSIFKIIWNAVKIVAHQQMGS